MNAISFLPIVAFALLANFEAPVASAQFGSLFGGPKVETIQTSDLYKMLQRQQQAGAKAKKSAPKLPQPDFVVVDIRSDAEVNVSVIPGAITKAQYEKNRQQYEGRMLIPDCTVGDRCAAYAKQLAKQGAKVKNYQGSILKWVEAGLPVVTLDGKPTNRVYSDRYRIPAKHEQVTE